MHKQIAISILDVNPTKLTSFLHQCKKVGVSHLHIDIGDTSFIPTITMSILTVLYIKSHDFNFDLHFMVNNPLSLITSLESKIQNCYITIHYEIDNFKETINYLVKNKIKNKWRIGVAIKPNTYDIIENDEIDRILIMTVEPGYGGQRMLKECVEKVKYYRDRIRIGCSIGVDGGVNEENIGVVKDADYFVVGSHFVNSENKIECLESLYREINQN